MADTTISGLSRILTTNTGAIIPISVDGVTSGIPVSGVITATGDKGLNAAGTGGRIVISYYPQ